MPKRILLLSSILLVPAIAQAALSVQLSIDPARTLPAIPVNFHVTVDNPDPKAQTLPNGGILIVTSATGDRWFARPIGNKLVENLTEFMLGVSTIAPRGHYIFDIPVGFTVATPSWFTDRRLNVPGTYRLTFALSDVDPNKLWGINPNALTDIAPNSALSNEVVLTVDTPTGDDAAVWQLLGARDPLGARAGGWTPDFAKKVLIEHPKSTYSRYAVVEYPFDSIENRIKAIEAVLAAFPNDPFADTYQLKLADLEERLYGKGWNHADASLMKLHGQRAVALYRTVIKNGHSTLYRWLAQKKLDEMLSVLEDDGVDVH